MATIKQVLVPDIGDFESVEVIDVAIKAGDAVQADDTLITLETNKAAMDVPAPFAGRVKEVAVEVGDRVSMGKLIALVEVDAEHAAVADVQAVETAAPAVERAASAEPQAPAGAAGVLPPPEAPPPAAASSAVQPAAKAYASPSVRHFAHELGVDLGQVQGSGMKGRITREDVQDFVKSTLVMPRGTGRQQAVDMPEVDFALFGAIEIRPLSRVKRLSGANLYRNWISIPHVTQHDAADITDMEAFRQELLVEYAAQGTKITLLAFLLKAVVEALQQFPEFNASLDAAGENLVLKKYFHIGVAVDTPEGLVVPVLRDVNQKGIVQLAKELAEMSARAREGKISAAGMQGGCFTISNLGGIGGAAFTPIINAPELAILGVSRSGMKPVWQEGRIEPRLMLPLSLSYDHRVIDGAAGARFIAYLVRTLSDVRRLAL